MFFYDKDMERMMQLKKQEIMREMETAKKRILEELNCVKRSVHTDFCDLLADYNRIDFQMKQLLATFKEEIAKLTTGYSDLISLKFAEYNDMVVDKVEQLEILEREIELFFSNKLAELEAMQTTVQGLIDKVGEIESTAVTQELFAQTIEQLMQIIQEMHNAMENRFYGKIDEIWEQFDYVNEEFSKNTTDHGNIRNEFAEADTAIREEFANADTAIREEMEANNAELMEQILAAQVQSDWNETNEENKAFILNKPFSKIGEASQHITGVTLTNDIVDGTVGGITNPDGGYYTIENFPPTQEFYCVFFKDDSVYPRDTPENIAFVTPVSRWKYIDDTHLLLHSYEDDNVKYECTALIRQDAGTAYHRVSASHRVEIKNRDVLPDTASVILYTRKVDYVRPDPWMFGNNAYTNRYLFLNDKSELEWLPFLRLISPNGTAFDISVTDDGTLSATPVSNE